MQAPQDLVSLLWAIAAVLGATVATLAGLYARGMSARAKELRHDVAKVQAEKEEMRKEVVSIREREVTSERERGDEMKELYQEGVKVLNRNNSLFEEILEDRKRGRR